MSTLTCSGFRKSLRVSNSSQRKAVESQKSSFGLGPSLIVGSLPDARFFRASSAGHGLAFSEIMGR